jgi:hypothetical protein
MFEKMQESQCGWTREDKRKMSGDRIREVAGG